MDVSSATDMVNPEEIPYSDILQSIPTIDISIDSYIKICNGKILTADEISTTQLGDIPYIFTRHQNSLSLLSKNISGYKVVRNNV